MNPQLHVDNLLMSLWGRCSKLSIATPGHISYFWGEKGQKEEV